MERLLEKYNIVNTLGSGSFGKVKLAVHHATRHKVALKFLERKLVKEETLVRAEREIDYLKCLQHPHIIKLYEVIHTTTDIVMVIEYAPNELFNHIKNKGRLSEEESRILFQQLVSAVEYCHRHAIVHRDLKPENLLLDSKLNLKIADFGLSNRLIDGEFLKTSCGSPNYAAPEIISSKMYSGPEVDVWSCGIILFVMLAGRMPFDEEFVPVLFQKITTANYEIPSFFSEDSKVLLQQMIVVDPLKRITIPEIRESLFFSNNLPTYLEPLPTPSKKNEFDQNLVKKVAKCLKLNSEAVLESLKNDLNQNDIHVSYSLCLDNENLWCGLRDEEIRRRELWCVSPFFLTAFEPRVFVPNLYPKLDSKQQTNRKWHVGVRSKSPPCEIMREIYRAMSQVGMDFKTIDTFHVRGRIKSVQKLEIRLFRAENDFYLIDFKMVLNGEKIPSSSPSVDLIEFPTNLRRRASSIMHQNTFRVVNVFGFMDLCSKIISELALE